LQVKHKVMSEGILAWISEQGLQAELGGQQGVLRMVLRALLVAGAKSFTHMITALERYCLVLQTLLAETGPQVLPSSSFSHMVCPAVRLRTA
jgi:nuclear cap-binding protein subunit 1